MNKLISPGGERRIPNKYDGFKHLANSCVMTRLRYVLPFVKRDFKVLDLGCGVGWQTKFLSLYCKHITGLDLSTDALKYAKKHNGASNISWVKSSMSSLENFKVNEFDLIVSIAAIEHITKEDMSRLFQSLNRLLKPQSHFVGTAAGFRKVSKSNATRWHLYEPSIADFSEVAKPYFSTITIKNFPIATPDLKSKVTEGYFLFRNQKK